MSTSETAGRVGERHQALRPEATPADRTSLEILGFILGGVTAVVITIAVLVVRSHLNTGVAAERSAPVVPASLSAQR